MTKKSQLEILSETYSEFNNDAQTQGSKIIELFDKIIAWIVGFATGTIALIVGSLDKLQFLGGNTINVTLGILVGSALLGIVGRICYAIAVYFGYQLMQLLNFQIAMLKFPHNNKPLLGTETSEEVYYILLEDFKVDIPSLLEDRNRVPLQNLHLLDENARTFYSQYFEWSQQTYEQSMGKISKIMIDTLGLDNNYFEKNKSLKKWKGKLLRGLTAASYVLNVMSILAFGASILYFFIQFLRVQY